MNGYEKDLRFNLILPQIHAMSKKQAFMQIAEETSDYLNISGKIIYDKIINKEILENSAIGDGIALPHLQFKAIQEPFALLATLKQEIDYDATDEMPVDVIAFTLSPEREGSFHLRRLARISRLLKNMGLHKKLRDARDRDVIESLLVDPEGWLLAA